MHNRNITKAYSLVEVPHELTLHVLLLHYMRGCISGLVVIT